MELPLTARLFPYCIALILALLLAELLQLRSRLSAKRAGALMLTDLAYNLSIYVAVTVALVHMLGFGKDLEHYLFDGRLYAVLGLFLLTSLLSLLPTFVFFNWRAPVCAGEAVHLPPGRPLQLRLCMLLEFAAVLAMGLLAAQIERSPGLAG